jgi:HEAT repeat protein
MRRLLHGLVVLLALVGPARAADVAQLIGELANPDAAVRERAQAALAAAGRPALQPLVRALGEDPVTRVAAMRALGKMNAAATPAIPYVFLALGSSDWELSREASKTLAAIGGPATARVIRGLDDTHLRYACITTLGEMGPAAKDAVPQLMRMLDNEKSFREGIVKTLARIGPDAIPSLRQALAHASPQISGAAAVALGEMEGQLTPDLVPQLTVALQSKDYKISWAALEQLGKLGTAAKEAVPAIKKSIQTADAHTKTYSAIALAAIAPTDPDAVKPLVESAIAEEYSSATEPLKKLGKPAVDALAQHAKDRNPMARLRVARLLAEFGDEAAGAAAVLTEMLKDTESGVRLSAARTLGRLGPAGKPAIPELEKLVNDPSPEVAEEALRALKTLK